MKQYGLGPNGGILTSLNLFATRFHQVLEFVEKASTEKKLKYVFIDTPGQIEVFTWSASGTIITDSLASSLPTCVIYVADTPRNSSPTTFMSNMVYACSIMYKTKLPLLVVFNKIDVVSHRFAVDWMTDFESFAAASQAEKAYSATLSRSLSLMLDEFYKTLRTVGVSAFSGAGIDQFFGELEKCKQEYMQVYEPYLQQRKDEIQAAEEAKQKQQLDRVTRDVAASKEKKNRPAHKKRSLYSSKGRRRLVMVAGS